jgi:hypothetical protein
MYKLYTPKIGFCKDKRHQIIRANSISKKFNNYPSTWASLIVHSWIFTLFSKIQFDTHLKIICLFHICLIWYSSRSIWVLSIHLISIPNCKNCKVHTPNGFPIHRFIIVNSMLDTMSKNLTNKLQKKVFRTFDIVIKYLWRISKNSPIKILNWPKHYNQNYSCLTIKFILSGEILNQWSKIFTLFQRIVVLSSNKIFS